ncbi:hypothetical protein ANN_07340 [Periplaneta americana]|uniref:Uncharacterized protein n=1 Tax=Periplaneta americana TaxID=6978 RepID=A0ABQ8SZL8_PERAM|nr:hypothetical protein ANN_07340 [Periplaneta americana]
MSAERVLALGSPVLEFPEVPVGESFRIQDLGLSDGLFAFRYISRFLSWIQPHDFPVELLRDALWSRMTVLELIAQSLRVEAGFVACLVIGALLAVGAPCVLLTHVCCRLLQARAWTGQPGGCALTCRRCSLVFAVQLVLLLLAAGVVAMFVTNQQVARAVQHTPGVVHAALSDVTTFLRNSQQQLRFVVTKSLDRAADAASADLDVQTKLRLGSSVTWISLVNLRRKSSTLRVHNTAADCSSRIGAPDMPTLISADELMAAQTADEELQHLLQSDSTSLQLTKIPLTESKEEIYCDVSTQVIRPHIPPCLRKKVFDNIHNLSHPSDVEELLGRPIQEELAAETGVDVAMDALVDVGLEARSLSGKVDLLLASCAEARQAMAEARQSLADLRLQVEAFRRQCPSRMRPLCDTIDATGLDIVLRLDAVSKPSPHPKIFFFRVHENTQMIRITELYMICDREISVWCNALQSEPLSVVAWNQRGPGYVPGESPSTQFVCESTKRQEWVLQDHDEQVADQPYPRHVRWATCLLAGDELLAALRDLRGSNLSAATQQARGEFQLIPQRMGQATRGAVAGVRGQLARRRDALHDAVWALDVVARDLSYRVESARADVLQAVDALEGVEEWRWLTGLGAALLVLLVWLLLVSGLSCGCCGSPRRAATTLLVSLVLVSLLSVVLWGVALSALLVGGHGEVFVCRPLYDEPQYSALTRLVDHPGVLFQHRGGFFSNLLYGNATLDVPVRDVLQACKDNSSTYTAFRLQQVLDVDTATDHRRWDTLHSELRGLQVDLSDLQLLTPDLQRHLQALLHATAVNLTRHRIQITGQVTGKDLSSFADQMTSVANQITDRATLSRLDTLATSTRQLVATHVQPLEQRKEDLVYQLTALEMQMMPLQRQVNQSLSHLKTIQYFINNQGSNIAYEKSANYTDRIVSYLDQYRAHVLNATQHGVAPCRPVWDLYHNMRLLFCRHGMDPLNGFWFATVWCLLLFLVATPLCLKLVGHYKQLARSGSGLLHSRSSE